MPNAPPPLHVLSLEPDLARKIIDLHRCSLQQGLRGVTVDSLLDGLCQQLVIAGVPLWRGFAGMRTLHPQWGGYGYTWRRDLNDIGQNAFGRGVDKNPDWL